VLVQTCVVSGGKVEPSLREMHNSRQERQGLCYGSLDVPTDD